MVDRDAVGVVRVQPSDHLPMFFNSYLRACVCVRVRVHVPRRHVQAMCRHMFHTGALLGTPCGDRIGSVLAQERGRPAHLHRPS